MSAPSELFNLHSLPQVDSTKSNIHIPWSYRSYKPKSAFQLQEHYPEIRSQDSDYGNKMWLLLSGEIPNLVVPWLMNGDNLPDAIMDMYNLHSFTQERGGFGPNVQNLMVLSVFADWRQDLPSKKDLPDAMRNKALEEQENIIEMALVIAQSSWSLAVATLMKYEAKVDTHVSLDGHSFPATQQFESLGINVVNITTAKLMIEAIRNGGYLDDSLETMIVGVDFGNLSLAWKLSQEEGFKLGIIHKKRTPIPDGTSSTTVHELVYGDVRGKRVIVMDDMIGSGGTILKTVKLLLQHGAAEIIVCAAHAVFAGREYYEQLQEVLSNDKVKLIMVSDTLPLERPARGGDKDLPYVFVKRDGQKEQRKVQILETDDFISYIVGVMLLNPTAQAITETMGVHVLQQVDPYDLYYQITGKKMPRPVATVRYREGGQFDRP